MVFNCFIHGCWAERGWRAALEEVLKRLDNICENDELKNWNEEELKDEGK